LRFECDFVKAKAKTDHAAHSTERKNIIDPLILRLYYIESLCHHRSLVRPPLSGFKLPSLTPEQAEFMSQYIFDLPEDEHMKLMDFNEKAWPEHWAEEGDHRKPSLQAFIDDTPVPYPPVREGTPVHPDGPSDAPLCPTAAPLYPTAAPQGSTASSSGSEGLMVIPVANGPVL
jgi:hypothetical protein